jgi:RNA polymerase sigma factor (sigma-70 family)
VSNYIQNIKEGDHISFEIVFKLWHKKLYAYFFKKTDDDDLAEELTQLAFIKLWRFKHTLTELHPIDLQLFRMAKSTLLDHFKKQANDELNLKLYHKEISDAATEQSSQFEAKQQLEQVLNCLPPTRKQVFLLNRIHGYTCKEIAEQLSISPRTVEKHIALAVKQLNGYAYVSFLVFLVGAIK